MERSRITLAPLRLVLRSPLVTARNAYAAREGLRITLQAVDGTVGQGEAMPLPEFGTESLEACAQALTQAAQCVGDVPAHPRGLAAWLKVLSGTPAARHGLELAALDVQARRAGLPLWRWLAPLVPLEEREGATSSILPHTPPRLCVPVNALLFSVEPASLVAEASEAIARGFRTLKVKVAGRPLEEDWARLGGLRAAVGPGIRLRVDANGGWSVPEAREALLRLGGVGLELCEQPVPQEDVEGLGLLRGRVPCAVAADEALALPCRAAKLVQAGAADVLVLKPMVLGGLLPALALAAQGARRGMGAYVTSALDGVVARAGAAHLAAVLPGAGPPPASGLAVGQLFADEPEHPYQPLGGAILLPDAPGLGLTEGGGREA